MAFLDQYQREFEDDPEFMMENLKQELAEARAENERLKERIRWQRHQLHWLNQSARAKNLALDALHYVWCDGGCPGGVHRWSPGAALTQEIVDEAERNTQRLRRWFHQHQFKEARDE